MYFLGNLISPDSFSLNYNTLFICYWYIIDNVYLITYIIVFLYSSIYILWRLVPSGNVPQGMATAEEPPPLLFSLLVESLPLYQHLFHACTPPILPAYNCRSLLGTPILLTYTRFTNSSLFFLLRLPNQNQTKEKVFHLFHYTTPLHLHKFPYHILYTRFHCSHPPILSRHMLLSDHSFPQHALLTNVPYTMSKSLIYTLVLTGEYYSLNLSLPPWTHFFLS